MDENEAGASIQPKSNLSEKNVLVEELEVHGDIPQARFGHTVTIVAKQKVVLFGGATGDTGKYSMTGETFMYNVLSKNWQKLQGKNLTSNCHLSQRSTTFTKSRTQQHKR